MTLGRNIFPTLFKSPLTFFGLDAEAYASLCARQLSASVSVHIVTHRHGPFYTLFVTLTLLSYRLQLPVCRSITNYTIHTKHPGLFAFGVSLFSLHFLTVKFELHKVNVKPRLHTAMSICAPDLHVAPVAHFPRIL